MRRILFAVAAEREEVMMVVVTVAGSQVERDVDPPSVMRERLEAFAGEVLAEAMNRPAAAHSGRPPPQPCSCKRSTRPAPPNSIYTKARIS